ncbi:hypothetical protein PsYK624_067030 [Phanerochaete sordida]|uniref:Uncharacterized protein n=1 Tax=Phanerochaete sordida TaxID=48140 RepID=A0A9P3G9R9_9APHY|nr:hypothetical protein PsYK624_067030 [Phanerochaete sordida]
MQFSTRFLALAALIGFATVVSALSIDVSGRNLDVVNRDVKVFEYTGRTDVMAPHDAELVRRQGWTYRNNEKLFALILIKNAFVLNAACGSGNPVTCAIGAGYAVLTFFFAAFRFQDRADIGDDAAPYFVYPPTAGSGRMVKRFSTELEHNQWHYVGHVQHQSLNHTVHYFTDGRIQRLRARTVPFWNATSSASKRQSDPDNDGGFVADYSWLSNNEGPYDSFDSTSDGTSYFAANLGGYMIANEGIASCAAFEDDQGTLDNGLMTYGWNNQEFEWTEPGEEESAYSQCQSGLGL